MTYADLQTQAQAALGAVVASMPTEGKTLTAYLAALHKRDIVALGEDEAFLLADKDGQVKARRSSWRRRAPGTPRGPPRPRRPRPGRTRARCT